MSTFTNEELIILNTQGEEWVLNELYYRFENMIYNFVHKHKHTNYLEDEEIKGSCHLALTKAIKDYNSDKKCTFAVMVYRYMQREISHTYDYLKRYDRDKLRGCSVSMNSEIEGKDGDSTQLIEILDSGLQNDSYFKDEFILTGSAVEYSLSTINENIRDYILDITLGNITMSELARILNMSRQNIKYHVDKFKNGVIQYVQQHDIELT